MAIDLTTTQTKYDKMVAVLDAIEATLDANKAELVKAMLMPNGKAKIKAFAQAQDPAWLARVNQFRNYLTGFFDDIGWED